MGNHIFLQREDWGAGTTAVVAEHVATATGHDNNTAALAASRGEAKGRTFLQRVLALGRGPAPPPPLHHSLRSLVMERCGITAPTVRVLARALRTCRGLTRLSLAHNPLKAAGVRSLCISLQSFDDRAMLVAAHHSDKEEAARMAAEAEEKHKHHLMAQFMMSSMDVMQGMMGDRTPSQVDVAQTMASIPLDKAAEIYESLGSLGADQLVSPVKAGESTGVVSKRSNAMSMGDTWSVVPGKDQESGPYAHPLILDDAAETPPAEGHALARRRWRDAVRGTLQREVVSPSAAVHMNLSRAARLMMWEKQRSLPRRASLLILDLSHTLLTDSGRKVKHNAHGQNPFSRLLSRRRNGRPSVSASAAYGFASAAHGGESTGGEKGDDYDDDDDDDDDDDEEEEEKEEEGDDDASTEEEPSRALLSLATMLNRHPQLHTLRLGGNNLQGPNVGDPDTLDALHKLLQRLQGSSVVSFDVEDTGLGGGAGVAEGDAKHKKKRKKQHVKDGEEEPASPLHWLLEGPCTASLASINLSGGTSL
jgi:hypothetical protein